MDVGTWKVHHTDQNIQMGESAKLGENDSNGTGGSYADQTSCAMSTNRTTLSPFGCLNNCRI